MGSIARRDDLRDCVWRQELETGESTLRDLSETKEPSRGHALSGQEFLVDPEPEGCGDLGGTLHQSGAADCSSVRIQSDLLAAGEPAPPSRRKLETAGGCGSERNEIRELLQLLGSPRR